MVFGTWYMVTLRYMSLVLFGIISFCGLVLSLLQHPLLWMEENERNLAPFDRWFILFFIGFQVSTILLVVKDFFHPPCLFQNHPQTNSKDPEKNLVATSESAVGKHCKSLCPDP